MNLRALALGILVASPAASADLVEPSYEPIPVAAQTYDWTGLYVGGQLGGAFGGGRDGLALDADGDGDFNDLDTLGIVFSEGEDDDGGFVGGAHVGYDMQFGSFLVGAVADATYINADFASEITSSGAPISGIYQNIDFVGTARARAGFALDRALVYGTGGLAVAGVDTDFDTIIDPALLPGSSLSEDAEDTLVGYAVGGGLDYAVTDQISIGGQYLYTRFDDADATQTFSNPGDADLSVKTDDRIDFNRIEATLSYRFN